MPIDMPPVDSLQNNEADKTEQVSHSRGERTATQKDENGKEFIVINGKKFFLEPERKIKQVEIEKIESKTGVVLSSKQEKPMQVSELE